ncbi:hypothetical protein N474_17900 [Pseudoalteromonas luteoviolacea CPMOR-2]|uniref:MalT-like TPR region domain-containing protein n=1 Tax=Pseudoalteromonas luteoviolacea DSM 6061 TaxID=1365250 RepID=A0A161ZTV6_9GAMM|nr:hypothetical protein [Pseudoalteromonas luteoviolacea]KZN32502.1 hypothetical protein N475_21875 [Pseudoalteromonas luteoviolacea DSM 6061]KZN54678.1 hypothetical protein N474_17900 [Pseudoalteromonas luteoviolacea CPMOR-2]
MTWMARGDRKRQEQKHDQALLNYQTAYKYANLRNDIWLMGMSLLKQASVHIDKGDFATAKEYLQRVKTIQRFEGVDLSHSTKAIQAKSEYIKGNQIGAIELVNDLITVFKENQEKSIYYRWLKMKYAQEQVDFSTLDADLQQLIALKSSAKLENIEVMSFVLYQNAQWRAERLDKSAEDAIKSAIAHFSQLELTNRIRDCYILLAKYYKAKGDSQSTAYFEGRADSLKFTNN